MPSDPILRMGEIGLLGGPFPTSYGGGGWDHVSLALANEEYVLNGERIWITNGGIADLGLDEFTELRWINIQREPRTFP